MTKAQLEARIEQARSVIVGLLVHPKNGYSTRDAQEWLDHESFPPCSICRSRHRSDDRHPCE